MKEPTLDEVTAALRERADFEGNVPTGIAWILIRDKNWFGRVTDVLRVLTDDAETMGYLAGGRRPDEVGRSLAAWVDSPLSIEEIRLVVAAGGWDPDPFGVLARAGVLETVLYDHGSFRRVGGEMVGGWVSDELALSDDAEILAAVGRILEEAEPTARAG